MKFKKKLLQISKIKNQHQEIMMFMLKFFHLIEYFAIMLSKKILIFLNIFLLYSLI